ncbi:MAG: hypothetical protein JW924_04235 [Fusobacteriaceae bacterium]|nr:hypothetical protein [Fusobacteriaceae bacterium]
MKSLLAGYFFINIIFVLVSVIRFNKNEEVFKKYEEKAFVRSLISIFLFGSLYYIFFSLVDIYFKTKRLINIISDK